MKATTSSLAIFTVATLVGFALLVFACGSSDATTGASREGGIADVALAEGAWGAGACAVCTYEKCSEERALCRAEPGCARNLDCVEQCPSTATGDPEPACVALCPAAGASAAEGPRLALEQCRTTGAATTCAVCPASVLRRYSHPLLGSSCAPTSFDAGIDPTPVVLKCTECTATRCSCARKECLADENCYPLKDCINACGNLGTACSDACLANYDGSIGHLFGLLQCSVTRCMAECEVPEDPCVHCLYEDCADSSMACQSDHDCYLLGQCTKQCDREQCHRACRDQFPKAVALFSAQLLCVEQRCPTCR